MKKVIRLYVIKDHNFFEVCFDSRLSFNDNLRLLKDIYKLDTTNVHIYDEYANRFVAMDIPIDKFNFNDYVKLTLF